MTFVITLTACGSKKVPFKNYGDNLGGGPGGGRVDN